MFPGEAMVSPRPASMLVHQTPDWRADRSSAMHAIIRATDRDEAPGSTLEAYRTVPGRSVRDQPQKYTDQ